MCTSAICQIEVLGYHQLKKIEKAYLENFFAAIKVMPLDDAVLEKTIELKQRRNIATPDAILAATAIIHDVPLLTQNKKDFAKVKSLKVLSIEDL